MKWKSCNLLVFKNIYWKCKNISFTLLEETFLRSFVFVLITDARPASRLSEAFPEFFENIKIDRSFLFRRVSCQYWTHFFGNFTYNWNLNELAPPFSRFDSSESFCQVASKYLLTKMKTFSHFLNFAQLERHFLHIKGRPILPILVNSEPPECVLSFHHPFYVKLVRSILALKSSWRKMWSSVQVFLLLSN